MHSINLAAREARVRRLARSYGLQLVKSRSRTPEALEYGGYGVIDPYINCWIYGSSPFAFSASLGDVEAWFASD